MSNADEVKAYDNLPPVLREAVRASPWPLPCERLARTAQIAGVTVALRRLRLWEQEFRDSHELITRQACER